MKHVALGIVIGLVFGMAVSAGAGVGSFFYNVTAIYGQNGSFQHGYVAGVYDAVQWLADIAAESGGLNAQALVATAGCLDRQGNTVGEFTRYASMALPRAHGSDSAAGAIIAACVPQ
jgi:hypothetical protein